MKLPDVIIPTEKLFDYCLNPAHPRGGDKAKLFGQALGINLENADVFIELLMTAAKNEEATLVRTDRYGQYYRLDFSADGVRGKETVRSTWMIRKGSDKARLVSCFVKRRR